MNDNEIVLMACGHTANAEYEGNPCCLICAPKKEAFEIKEIKHKPSLKKRRAKCSDCGRITSSKWDLPFFEYKPNEKYDEYYCGCRGWD